jgi:hypothetical protein
LYLSAPDAAKSPKYPVSCLLPANARCPGGFYLDSALSFYPQAGFAHFAGTAIRWSCGLDENFWETSGLLL